MIRITISQAAFAAIVATLPLGSVAYKAETDAKGERLIWLEPKWADKLGAMRGPGESYSDVIVRIVAMRDDRVGPASFAFRAAARLPPHSRRGGRRTPGERTRDITFLAEQR
jgi:hypothetical protein